MTQNPNPLAKYYRTPGPHVKIPSGGRFSEIDKSKLSMNGELPVYPMTAADEILVKNPDALLNGFAVEELIKSCVPAVLNARTLAAQDIDVLLLAIKLASYGDKMEVGAVCPSCKHENDFEISIQNDILPYVVAMEDDYEVRLSEDLVAYLRPYNYEAQTQVQMKAFEETKILQSLINQETTDSEKLQTFNESFKKITEFNLELMSQCILRIVTPDAEVTDPEIISEFIKNAEKEQTKAIQKKMDEFSKAGVQKETEAVCSACEHKWSTEYTFDPSHFFA